MFGQENRGHQKGTRVQLSTKQAVKGKRIGHSYTDVTLYLFYDHTRRNKIGIVQTLAPQAMDEKSAHRSNKEAKFTGPLDWDENR